MSRDEESAFGQDEKSGPAARRVLPEKERTAGSELFEQAFRDGPLGPPGPVIGAGDEDPAGKVGVDHDVELVVDLGRLDQVRTGVSRVEVLDEPVRVVPGGVILDLAVELRDLAVEGAADAEVVVGNAEDLVGVRSGLEDDPGKGVDGEEDQGGDDRHDDEGLATDGHRRFFLAPILASGGPPRNHPPGLIAG